MSGYWLGLATVPAVLVAVALALLAARFLLRAAAKVGGAVARIRPESDTRHRAVLASTTFAAERVWFLGMGDVGVAIYTGQDSDRRQDAYDRLNPKLTLNRLFFEESDA